jgi:hypothetical protein
LIVLITPYLLTKKDMLAPEVESLQITDDFDQKKKYTEN